MGTVFIGQNLTSTYVRIWRLHLSDYDVYRRQILTYKDGPCTERAKSLFVWCLSVNMLLYYAHVPHQKRVSWADRYEEAFDYSRTRVIDEYLQLCNRRVSGKVMMPQLKLGFTHSRNFELLFDIFKYTTVFDNIFLQCGCRNLDHKENLNEMKYLRIKKVRTVLMPW